MKLETYIIIPAVTCPNPAKPSNGWFRYSSGVSGPSYRSVATFGCSSGYHMQGSSQRTCQVNGQWDGTQPTCQGKYNDIYFVYHPIPSHGMVNHIIWQLNLVMQNQGPHKRS